MTAAPASEHGPFEDEASVSSTPAVRAVFAAFDADPGPGKMSPHNLAMLTGACEAAGVELGRYDKRILAGFSQWEPATCKVLASLIARAYQAGRDSREDVP